MAVQALKQETQTGIIGRDTIRVQGAEIFVYESGTGMPVLYLHGSPDTHDMWLPAIQNLGDDVHSIAIDLPGFGQSTLPDKFSLSLDNMGGFYPWTRHFTEY